MNSSEVKQGGRRGFRFSIDRGGTFTDVYSEVPGGGHRVVKLLSKDPANYPDAPTEGIRRILEDVSGIPHPRGHPLDTSRIDYIRMGTTVATNALLERDGERCALVITKGFRDLLYIGNQSRPQIFDLEINCAEALYDTVVEVEERVRLLRSADAVAADPEDVKGITGEYVRVLQKPDLEKLREDLMRVYDDGIRSLSVVLMHSYTFPEHEKIVGKLAREMGFTQISLSFDALPMVKIVPRGYTSCADAYLTPVIRKYVNSFKSGLDENVHEVKISFMRSDGGLTPVGSFSGHKAILSGPAGGVVGYAMTTYEKSIGQAVIGFDMGGTSTDVSRYAGRFEHVYESTTAGIIIQAPQLDINTVAAGGGSRLFWSGGMFVVGPESAGAHPGPVSYRKGGYLTVTDANVLLGRVLPEFFPKIFGPMENEPLDMCGTQRAFADLAKDINRAQIEYGRTPYSLDEIAYGFIQVANETMCRPIRNLTQMKGFDIKTHVLACFGGAGPQHACAIARSLGMKTIVVHRFSGVLSAYGLSVADIVEECQEPCALTYSSETKSSIEKSLEVLAERVRKSLKIQGFFERDQFIEYFLNLRYDGTDCAVMTPRPLSGDWGLAFETHYKREFGFVLQGRDLIVDDIRVRGVGRTASTARESLTKATEVPVARTSARVYFEGGRRDTPVFILSDLTAGHTVEGPAIIMQNVSTVVVEPGCMARITDYGDIRITVDAEEHIKIGTELDVIQVSIFSHRFMSIAEQMGRTLQRTSVSVNVKERLDFSCAIFGADGGLVANAPHVPVHLGAMQQAVKFQLAHWGGGLVEGDVLVSNHPQLAGGSHLPDITVMTPVFRDGRIVFFVASRAHHADIGGIAPGSMPPLSKTLEEEGAAIVACKLVTGTDGVFQQERMTQLLLAPGKLPNNSGTRNLSDNLSDLRAQVAANTRGVTLMHELISGYGLNVVVAYMAHIQANAEYAVREMLHAFSLKRGLPPVGSVSAEDYMDDGTKIALKVTIDRNTKSATFDFTGTGTQVYGNTNAPVAVTYSAVIYTLRCLLTGIDIPLNQGCLEPITIIIPEGCLLNPCSNAAVVGGNVLTSQRVTDVVLRAFEACAASQGCMNNLTFGDKTMGYYETIAGGAGAGPGWNGRSSVHTHMTNTRITDPEVLERRYPVILRQFGRREGSGGTGAYHGGDGVVREIEFLRPLTVSILSERRAFQPYGMHGGLPGERGVNILTRNGGEKSNLGGKNTVEVDLNDRLCILTPGGGGYGSPDGTSSEYECPL